MRTVMPGRACAARGFTLIEALVVVAIIGFGLAVGIPLMSEWALTNKVKSASQFYAEGIQLARGEALRRNAFSRIVFIDNAKNGQSDWRVDLCFPAAGKLCNASGSWSGAGAVAADDPDQSAGFKSVYRSADPLPDEKFMTQTLMPDSSSAIYFTPLGWVDTTAASRVTSIKLEPTPAYASKFVATTVQIPLVGIPVKCEPQAPAGDSRRCIQ